MDLKRFAPIVLLIVVASFSCGITCTYTYVRGSTLVVNDSHVFSVGPVSDNPSCPFVFFTPGSSDTLPPIQIVYPYQHYTPKYYIAPSTHCVYFNLTNGTYIMWPASMTAAGVCVPTSDSYMVIKVEVSPLGGCKACQGVKNFKRADLFVSQDQDKKMFYVQGVLEESVGSRKPLAYKPFIVWIHNTTYSDLCTIESNGNGIAELKYDDRFAMNYYFMYCCYNKSCGLKECLRALGVHGDALNGISSISDLPVCKDAVEVDHPYTKSVPAFPAITKVSIAPTNSKQTLDFCLPIMFIFSFLLAAMLMMGRNPLSLFDISSLHMRRHITYTPRGMQVGMKISSRFVYGEIESVGVALGSAAASKDGGNKKSAGKKVSFKTMLKNMFTLKNIKKAFKGKVKSEENQVLAIKLVPKVLGYSFMGLFSSKYAAKAGAALSALNAVVQGQGQDAKSVGSGSQRQMQGTLIGNSNDMSVLMNVTRGFLLAASGIREALADLAQGKFLQALEALSAGIVNFYLSCFFGMTLATWRNLADQTVETYETIKKVKQAMEKGEMTKLAKEAQQDPQLLQALRAWDRGGKEVLWDVMEGMTGVLGFASVFRMVFPKQDLNWDGTVVAKLSDQMKEELSKMNVKISPYTTTKRIQGHSKEVVVQGKYIVHFTSFDQVAALISMWSKNRESNSPHARELTNLLQQVFGAGKSADTLQAKIMLFMDGVTEYKWQQAQQILSENPTLKQEYEKKKNKIMVDELKKICPNLGKLASGLQLNLKRTGKDLVKYTEKISVKSWKQNYGSDGVKYMKQVETNLEKLVSKGKIKEAKQLLRDSGLTADQQVQVVSVCMANSIIQTSFMKPSSIKEQSASKQQSTSKEPLEETLKRVMSLLPSSVPEQNKALSTAADLVSKAYVAEIPHEVVQQSLENTISNTSKIKSNSSVAKVLKNNELMNNIANSLPLLMDIAQNKQTLKQKLELQSWYKNIKNEEERSAIVDLISTAAKKNPKMMSQIEKTIEDLHPVLTHIGATLQSIPAVATNVALDTTVYGDYSAEKIEQFDQILKTSTNEKINNKAVKAVDFAVTTLESDIHPQKQDQQKTKEYQHIYVVFRSSQEASKKIEPSTQNNSLTLYVDPNTEVGKWLKVSGCLTECSVSKETGTYSLNRSLFEKYREALNEWSSQKRSQKISPLVDYSARALSLGSKALKTLQEHSLQDLAANPVDATLPEPTGKSNTDGVLLMRTPQRFATLDEVVTTLTKVTETFNPKGNAPGSVGSSESKTTSSTMPTTHNTHLPSRSSRSSNDSNNQAVNQSKATRVVNSSRVHLTEGRYEEHSYSNNLDQQPNKAVRIVKRESLYGKQRDKTQEHMVDSHSQDTDVLTKSKSLAVNKASDRRFRKKKKGEQ